MTFSINPTMTKTQADFQMMAIQQNGTMSSSSTTMTPPTTGNVAAPQSSVANGTGPVENGQCTCSCLCGTNAYAPGLGIGMMGGLGGMVPASG